MIEVSNQQIKLLAENQDLKLQVQEHQASKLSMSKYLVGLGMAFYISLTIMTVAIIDVNKQQSTIDEYRQIIQTQDNALSELTASLIKQSLSMEELKSDYRMVQELGK